MISQSLKQALNDFGIIESDITKNELIAFPVQFWANSDQETLDATRCNVLELNQRFPALQLSRDDFVLMEVNSNHLFVKCSHVVKAKLLEMELSELPHPPVKSCRFCKRKNHFAYECEEKFRSADPAHAMPVCGRCYEQYPLGTACTKPPKTCTLCGQSRHSPTKCLLAHHHLEQGRALQAARQARRAPLRLSEVQGWPPGLFLLLLLPFSPILPFLFSLRLLLRTHRTRPKSSVHGGPSCKLFLSYSQRAHRTNRSLLHLFELLPQQFRPRHRASNSPWSSSLGWPSCCYRTPLDSTLLNSPLHTRKMKASPKCEHCGQPEVIKHVILSCSQYDSAHSDLFAPSDSGLQTIISWRSASVALQIGSSKDENLLPINALRPRSS